MALLIVVGFGSSGNNTVVRDHDRLWKEVFALRGGLRPRAVRHRPLAITLRDIARCNELARPTLVPACGEASGSTGG